MKTIESKAQAYANNNASAQDDYRIRISLRNAYIAGAKEALAGQWRSVEDELPEENTLVLCRMKDSGAIVSGFITKRWHPYPEVSTDAGFHFEDYGGYECTHWMPLPPNTPEENENTKQDPRECNLYDDGTCNKNKHKAVVDGNYWCYPCRLFYGFPCSDFTPKTE